MHFFTILSAAALAFASWSTAVPLTYEVLPLNSTIHDTDAVVFSSCGGKGDTLKIKSITISPDPPVVGRDIRITVTGRLNRDLLPNTKVELTAYFGIIKVRDTTFDLCTQMGLHCPVQATPNADQTVVATMPVDSSIPAGITIKARLEAKNPDDGSPAFCMEGKLTFKH